MSANESIAIAGCYYNSDYRFIDLTALIIDNFLINGTYEVLNYEYTACCAALVNGSMRCSVDTLYYPESFIYDPNVPNSLSGETLVAVFYGGVSGYTSSWMNSGSNNCVLSIAQYELSKYGYIPCLFYPFCGDPLFGETKTLSVITSYGLKASGSGDIFLNFPSSFDKTFLDDTTTAYPSLSPVTHPSINNGMSLD